MVTFIGFLDLHVRQPKLIQQMARQLCTAALTAITIGGLAVFLQHLLNPETRQDNAGKQRKDKDDPYHSDTIEE